MAKKKPYTARKIGLRECAHCGKLVRGRGSVCPKCGSNWCESLEEEKDKKEKQEGK